MGKESDRAAGATVPGCRIYWQSEVGNVSVLQGSLFYFKERPYVWASVMAQKGRGQTLLLNFGVNQCQGITGVANSLFQRGVERGIPDQKTDLTVCQ